MKSYDYIQTTIEIKSSLYDRACQIIKTRQESPKAEKSDNAESQDTKTIEKADDS